MAQADEDPVVSAKRALAETKGLAASIPRAPAKRDARGNIELPNETGAIDPRILAAERAASPKASRPVSTKDEQPRDIRSNVALRRSLTSGRR